MIEQRPLHVLGHDKPWSIDIQAASYATMRYLKGQLHHDLSSDEIVRVHFEEFALEAIVPLNDPEGKRKMPFSVSLR